MNVIEIAEKLEQDLIYAAPELHRQKIVDCISAVLLEDARDHARAVSASATVVVATGLTKIEISPNGEWARFLFDEEGMLAVCSSCGNYGFTFVAPGSRGLRAFLIDGGRDVDYFRGKFEYQFHGKLSRRQVAELNGFFKKIWPTFIEALRTS